jgi:hypothetical protein
MLFTVKFKKNITLFTLAGLCMLVVAILRFPRFKLAGGTVPDLNLLAVFQKGEIVYGTDISIRMPPLEITPSNSLKDFFFYIISHPYESLLLGFTRIFSELILVRPWYSFALNIVLITFSFFILIFSFVGLSAPSPKNFRSNLIILVLPQVVLIAVTWSIWESRFGQVILNMLLPSSALGFSRILKIFK